MKESVPPRIAIVKLKKWGYSVSDWHCVNDDGGDVLYWFGYSNTTSGICVVTPLTGRLLVEICTRHKLEEILT